METNPPVPVRRKRLCFWLLTFGGLAVMAGSTLAVVFSTSERIAPANYRKIKVRMKVAEVEELLGELDHQGRFVEDMSIEDAMNYGDAVRANRFDGENTLQEGDDLPSSEYRWWIGRHYYIKVGVDPLTRRVCYKYIGAVRKPGSWERIKTYLHLDNLF